MPCNGVCHRYARTGFMRTGIVRGWYKLGLKRCKACDVYLKWDGVWCPCCNGKLSTRPKRTQAHKRWLLEREANGTVRRY